MIIDVFAKGQGGGAGPIDYLIALDVLAYDENRNVLRDENGDVIMKRRHPPPDIMRGDPNITRDLINSSPFEWSYVSGVVAFTPEDNPSEEQQQEAMDAFERLAFAGLEPEQYNILWVRHTHEGKVELHFCLPRLELISGKSLNPCPPGFEKAFNSLRDVLNKRYGWADPEAPSRARERKNVKESQSRAETRDEIQNWIENQIVAGTINDRSEMIEALQKVGLEVPRTGKNYITVKDPETGERWRMKGVIFHEGWTRDETIAREIAAKNRGNSGSPTPARRLDGIDLAELQERLGSHIDRRTEYNQSRYPRPYERSRDGIEPGTVREATASDPKRGVPEQPVGYSDDDRQGTNENYGSFGTIGNADEETKDDGRSGDPLNAGDLLASGANPAGPSAARQTNVPPTARPISDHGHQNRRDGQLLDAADRSTASMLESGVLTDDTKPSRNQSTHLADATRARVDIIHRRIGDTIERAQRRAEKSTAGYRQLADKTARSARSFMQGLSVLSNGLQHCLDWLGWRSERPEKSGPLVSSVQGSGKSRASRFVGIIMKIYEQRQREQEERAKREQEIERAKARPATSPRSKEQVRSFDHLDAADFERRIDLETGEFLDGDDYVADASNHDNRPPVGQKAGSSSGQTNSTAHAPRREPAGRMTEQMARTEEPRLPRPPAPISQPTNDKRQVPPVTSSSAQAQSKPNGGEILPQKRRRDRGYER
ncbi:relaxase/mobilization nuclease domain-containing protein [Cohaesibacter haloalkalitolerans]|uniref:relaxase/mobilization nuclease domain-containing protein n=1 Tax=Cohaesibacter haloalkalitolerans TaxID=1162980 RepID=UPI0013C4DDAA|nr:relaxase/mobilization nuclease domain-containing protein [Cohaesibacter haloalkalitolerans]